MCAIGDYDSICGFSALGIDTFEVTEDSDIEQIIVNLSHDSYVIMLITENAAARATDIIDKYKTEKTPAIIPIPSVTGAVGIGMNNLKNAVERAVGSSEMIFGSDN